MVRQHEILLGQVQLKLPCFFPSISSIKTNLLPADYAELLDAAAFPLFLASAYDIAQARPDDQERMLSALARSKKKGSVILIDSGNYESYWSNDSSWTSGQYHQALRFTPHHLCFCFDNQKPPNSADAVADEIENTVLRDQEYSLGTVIPIVHGSSDVLPECTRLVAERLFPLILAVPERALGDGILARIRTVKKIRASLDTLPAYCPLHLLGTGNPISLAAYGIAGADSFDGLEWCQTVVDHESGRLLHFQHWDIVRGQTEWGTSRQFPFAQLTLLHNLQFYRDFMIRLRSGFANGKEKEILVQLLPQKQSEQLLEVLAEKVDQ